MTSKPHFSSQEGKTATSVRVRYRHPAFGLPLLRRYQAICIGREIWFKESKGAATEQLMRHEMVHQAQMDRDGVLLFYVRYLVSYIKNLFIYRDHHLAYWNIPYEREAREKGESDTGGSNPV